MPKEKTSRVGLWPINKKKESSFNFGLFNFNKSLVDRTLGEYFPEFISKRMPEKLRDMHVPAVSLGWYNYADHTDNALMIGVVNCIDGYDTDDNVMIAPLNFIRDVPYDRGRVRTRLRPLVSFSVSLDGVLSHS